MKRESDMWDSFGNGIALYKMILQKLNASFEILTQRNLGNQHISHILAKNYAQLVLSDMALYHNTSKLFDITYPFTSMKVYFFVSLKFEVYDFRFLVESFGQKPALFIFSIIILLVFIAKIFILRRFLLIDLIVLTINDGDSFLLRI